MKNATVLSAALLAFTALGFVACATDSQSTMPILAAQGGISQTTPPATGGATTGQGGSATGGASSGTGGNATGGVSVGGASTGGRAAGGAATGGRAAGGASTGGRTAGGAATGGRAAGGASTGGAATSGGTTSVGGAASGGSGNTGNCANFSFFVASMAAMQRLSGSNNGFGGDLRFGKSDGLTGADAICQSIATTALACAGNKTWKAFLCTGTVDGIDRVGTGPWYDRGGLKVWSTLTEMTSADRPPSSYKYRDDLPNEDGVPNHDYDLDGTTNDDDNHDFLTGCGANGRKIAADTAAHRCDEWTSTTAVPSGSTGGPGFPGMMMNGPMCGHSWPRMGSGTNWVSSIREGGCGAGINLQDTGAATSATVGSGGGYGGIYCFATTP